MSARTVVIAARFNGPPTSGNGGYVSGLMARELDGPAVVTLRIPPPLETPLTIERSENGVRLLHGDVLIGDARPAEFDPTVPPFPGIDAAETARSRYLGLLHHRYPTCFTCGTARPAQDGLDLFTGALGDSGRVASTWTPGADLADAGGLIAPEFIHAALDCPTFWALPRAAEISALLARFTARIDGERPRPGETCAVLAWPISSEGRKHRGGAALYGGDSRLIARAEALWIEPKNA